MSGQDNRLTGGNLDFLFLVLFHPQVERGWIVNNPFVHGDFQHFLCRQILVDFCIGRIPDLLAAGYAHKQRFELCTFDENGNEQTVYLARENDRVRKDGANNSHRVIDKLARYKGDNTKVLAVVHISELLATSEHEKNTDEHNHQWMDSRGWEYRKTYVQDTAGNIYSATLNIARGNDRNILYDINNVRRIDEGSTAGGVVSSARRSGRDSLTSHNASSPSSVAQSAENVKRENENLTTIRVEL